MSSKLDPKVIEAMQNIITLQGEPVTLANAAKDAVNGDKTGAAIGLLSTVESFVAVVSKSVPGAGTVITGLDLTHNFIEAKENIRDFGYITDRTLLSLTADVTVLVSFGTAAMLAGTAGAVTAVAVGTVATAALGVIALAQTDSDTEMGAAVIDALNQVQDIATQTGQSLTDLLEKFGETTADGIESLVHAMESLAEGLVDALPDSDNLGISHDSSMKEVKDLFKDAEQTPAPPTPIIVSPLILDLDGDGVETVNIAEGVYFDHRGDGFAERSGWVADDDGLLVWDRNGDGLINDGSELFGDSTRLMNGSLATDGFQALAEYDDNADGKIDSADAIWNNLRIWQDMIRDGNATAGELHTLSDLNIRSISTATTSPGTQDAAGNIETLLGSFERTDGTIAQIADYNFLADNTDTIVSSSVEITPEIAGLPGARGYGRTYDLHQAMARDTSGALMTQVQSYVAETDPTARDAILEQIIFKWAGVEEVDPASRGGLMDARVLVVLETFLGEGYIGALGPNPILSATPALEQAYIKLYELVNAQLLAQTHAKPLYDHINFIWNETSHSFLASDSRSPGAICHRSRGRRDDAGAIRTHVTRIRSGVSTGFRPVSFRHCGVGGRCTVGIGCQW